MDFRRRIAYPVFFRTVVQAIQSRWVGGEQHQARLWRVAAQHALRVSDPPSELVPLEFLLAERGVPDNHGRYDGPYEAATCGKKQLGNLVMHRIPAAALAWQPPADATQTVAAWVSAREQRRDLAWQDVPQTRAMFECAMDWLLGALDAELDAADARFLEFGQDHDVEKRQADGWLKAADELIDGLDPHSRVMTTKQSNDQFNQKRKTIKAYAGLMVHDDAGVVKVWDVLRDTAAWQADVRVNDVVVSIDGKPASEASKVGAQLKSNQGGQVRVVLRRAGVERRVVLKLRPVPLPDVAGRLLDGMPDVGVVRLREFVGQTSARLASEVARLQRSAGRPLRGLVLDLRDNPGGLLVEAVQMADLFLGQGTIATVHYRGEMTQTFTARPEPTDLELPVVVLVDGGCASACELVTLALRSHGRAVVLGERTFGKATVQSVVSSDDVDRDIWLTMGRYFVGDLALSPQAIGIMPDLSVPSFPGATPQKVTREEDLPRHLPAVPAAVPANPLVSELVLGCARETQQVDHAWAAGDHPRERPDYRLLMAEHTLRCMGRTMAGR